MEFDVWIKELKKIATDNDNEDAIDLENPEEYREYFEDGDSPEECYFDQIS